MSMPVRLKPRTSCATPRVVRRSFFPITFPLTTGPGTIAACIALGAQASATPATYILGAFIAVSGAAVVSALLYLIFKHATLVVNWLGEVGMLVMVRSWHSFFYVSQFKLFGMVGVN